MEVGDALGRVHHRQLGAVFVAGVQIGLDFVLLALRQGGDPVVQVDHAVVDVDAQLVEQLAVLGKRVLVEDPHAVTEHDGVRHLHHGGLTCSENITAGLARVLNLSFIEFEQGFLAHEHAVDDFLVEQRHLGLEHDGLAALVTNSILTSRALVQGDRLFTGIEVAMVHVRHVRTGGLAHSAIACGFLRAYSFTARGARRSELPSRSTDSPRWPVHLT